MLKKFLCAASAALLMFLTLGCGKQEIVEPKELTIEYAEAYVLSLASYSERNVNVKKDSYSDKAVEDYADFYYREMAESIEGLKDSEGNILPLSDETVAKLGFEAFSTVKEFKLFSREAVLRYIDEKFKTKVVEEVLSEVVRESSFAEPDMGILEGQKKYVENDYSLIASKYEMDVSTFTEYLGTPMDELCEDYAKLTSVCYLIASEQGIDTSDRDTMLSEVSDYIFSVTKTE